MAQRWSLAVCAYLLFSLIPIHPISVTAQEVVEIIHPQVPSDDFPIATRQAGEDITIINLDGYGHGVRAQPFLPGVAAGGWNEVLHSLLKLLAEALKDLDKAVRNAAKEGANSTTSVHHTTSTSTTRFASSVVDSACSAYSLYQTNCAVTATYTSTTICLSNEACATLSPERQSADAFASCACYSSTYWVPNLYDNVYFICNQRSSGKGGFTSTYHTGPHGRVDGFCAQRNIRHVPVSAIGIDAVVATSASTLAVATITSATATAADTITSSTFATTATTITAVASPTGGGRKVGMDREIWVLMGSMALVAALVAT